MTYDKNRVLPLGSIVALRRSAKKVMIVARAVSIRQKGKEIYFEYAACGYPEGITNDQLFFLDVKDIAEVIFTGYEDRDEEIVVKDIEAWRREKKQNQVV